MRGLGVREGWEGEPLGRGSMSLSQPLHHPFPPCSFYVAMQVAQAFLNGRMKGMGDALHHLELWGYKLEHVQVGVRCRRMLTCSHCCTALPPPSCHSGIQPMVPCIFLSAEPSFAANLALTRPHFPSYWNVRPFSLPPTTLTTGSRASRRTSGAG
jgi:hypothetical protein